MPRNYTISISDTLRLHFGSAAPHENSIAVSESEWRNLPSAIGNWLRNAKNDAIAVDYFYHTENPDKALHKIQQMLPTVRAAGGLVVNSAGELLMILRRGKWDLPKGKLEHGETPEDAALREVQEETGISHLSREAKAADTFHIYLEKNHPVLKHTVWYFMKSGGNELPVAQAEEEITEARWCNAKDIEHAAAATFENVRALLRIFQERT